MIKTYFFLLLGITLSNFACLPAIASSPSQYHPARKHYLDYSIYINLIYTNGSIVNGPYYLVNSSHGYYLRFLRSDIQENESILGECTRLMEEHNFDDSDIDASWLYMSTGIYFVVANVNPYEYYNSGYHWIDYKWGTIVSGHIRLASDCYVSTQTRYYGDPVYDAGNLRLAAWFINNSLPQGYVFNDTKDDLNHYVIREKTTDGFNVTMENSSVTNNWTYFDASGLGVRGRISKLFDQPSPFSRIILTWNLATQQITTSDVILITSITISIIIVISGNVIAVITGIRTWYRKIRSLDAMKVHDLHSPEIDGPTGKEGAT